MRPALVVAALELRRRIRDRSLLIQGVVGPIVLAGIIGFAFGGGGGALEVRLGLVDDDGSALTARLLEGLREAAAADDGPPVELVDLAGPAAARAAVDAGDVDAALVVPDGFGDGVVAGDPVELAVVASGAQRVAGDLAVSLAEQLAASVDASRLAAVVGGEAGSVSPSEPLLTGPVVDEEPVGGDFDAIAYFAPSMAILFLFFTVGAGARSVLRERTEGTLARVRASPVPDGALLVGKVGAVLAAGVVSLAVVWAVTAVAFGADWGDPLGVAVVLLATVVAIAGIAAVVTGLARSEAQAEAVTAAVAFVLALVGGNFIAPGALPALFERLSLLTPNGWALRALTDLSAGEAGVAAVVPTVGVLLAMGLVTGVVGARLLGRSLS